MNYRRTTTALSFLTVAGALLAFFIATPANAAVSDWMRGASMVPMSTTDLSTDHAQQSLRDLKATGATYVSFVVPYYQSNQWSTDVQRGWNTPTDESLSAAIAYARSIGLNVSLKMHIEPYDGAWRAHINPGDRDAWFNAYGDAVVHTATIAEESGADLFVIGSELVSMAATSMNGTNTAHWETLIDEVRAVYGGKLTYGANSNNTSDDPFNNEKKFIGFWGSLDYAGIDPYYQLSGDDSVESMKAAWDQWNKNDLQAFAQSVGKQILISEVGYRSLDNARLDPWNWERSGGIDQQEQANAYDALMGYWNDYPYIAGVMFWEWSTNPNAGGNDTTYTPQNKPAEEVMTRWFTDPNAPTTTPATSTPPVATTTPSTSTPPVATTTPATSTPPTDTPATTTPATSTPEHPDTGGEGTTTPPTNNPDEEPEEPVSDIRARIERPPRTVRPGEHLNFNGRDFGREEDISVQLNDLEIGRAHADGGGNFSTGSIPAPMDPGTYRYTLVGRESGANISAEVTVE